MPSNLRGKVHDLIHGKPKDSATSSSHVSETSPKNTPFDPDWKGYTERQQRYFKDLPPLPGEPEFTEEEQREARYLKDLEGAVLTMLCCDLMVERPRGRGKADEKKKR